MPPAAHVTIWQTLVMLDARWQVTATADQYKSLHPFSAYPQSNVTVFRTRDAADRLNVVKLLYAAAAAAVNET